jgi:hypothetical protein
MGCYTSKCEKRQNHCPLESMLPRAWKRFSVEIEGRKVDDEADEEEMEV